MKKLSLSFFSPGWSEIAKQTQVAEESQRPTSPCLLSMSTESKVCTTTPGKGYFLTYLTSQLFCYSLLKL